MTAVANGAVRCDGCGKISRNPLGEYVRKDGTTAYILAEEFYDGTAVGSIKDFCVECATPTPSED